MGRRRLPPEAFEVYFALGVGRTYQAVADHYGVSKTAVFNLAKREDWSQRVTARESQAREAMDKKAVETLEQMAERHVKIVKFIQRKALEALKSMPLTDAMSAVRALDVGLKQERLIRGEPTDRTAVTTEEIVKREYERWMTRTVVDDAEPDETDADAPDTEASDADD